MNESNPPTRGAVLGVHDLVVVYGTQTAVNGVSFQIERGEISDCSARTVPVKLAPSARSRAW
jgi:ABC-type uncharacterized transport system ATPase subunit